MNGSVIYEVSYIVETSVELLQPIKVSNSDDVVHF